MDKKMRHLRARVRHYSDEGTLLVAILSTFRKYNTHFRRTFSLHIAQDYHERGAV